MRENKVEGKYNGTEKNIFISVVTPVYKCEECIKTLYDRLKIVLGDISQDFEIIFVNDASPDNSWDVIRNISNSDHRVKGINFSRNFGQHHAITAGVDHAEGDYVVIMDCDLQDQPEEITKLYAKIQEGYDFVMGRRSKRKDSIFKKIASRLFYKVFDYLSGTKNDWTVANFGIYKRVVIKNLRKFGEHHRFFPYFVNWMGFKKGYVEIDHSQRSSGKSSYTFRKLLLLALNNIVAFSNKPLRLSIKIGFTIALISFFYAVYLLVMYLFHDIAVAGWTSVMVSVWFIGGLLFANMGVLGLYVGKIFDETKNRPLYIIKETIGIGEIKQRPPVCE